MRPGKIAGVGTILVFVGLLPWIVTLAAAAISALAGCDLDEGNVTPCRIAGIDFGGTLYGMFVFGWFGVLTLPLVVAGLLALAAAGLSGLLRRDRT